MGDNSHWPAVCIPEGARAGFSVFGVLRPPAEWYVSLWRHAVGGKGQHLDALRAWTGGSTGLDQCVAAWTSGERPAAADAYPLVIVPANPARVIEWRQGEGLWSYCMRYFFVGNGGEWAVDELVPIEDTDATIREWGIQLRPRKNVRAGHAPTLPSALLGAVDIADGDMHRTALAFARRKVAA